MSIQANFNQLLGMATVGAGFYTQTPGFKKKENIKALEKQLTGIEEVYAKETEKLSPEELAKIETSEAYKESMDAGYNVARQIALLDPTEKNVARAAEYRENRAKTEKMRRRETVAQEVAGAMTQALTEQQNTLREQARALAERIGYFKGGKK